MLQTRSHLRTSPQPHGAVVPGWFVLAGPATGFWLVVGLGAELPPLAWGLLFVGPLAVWVSLASLVVVSTLGAALWQSVRAAQAPSAEPAVGRSPPRVANAPRPATRRIRLQPTQPAELEPDCEEAEAEAERLLSEAAHRWRPTAVHAYPQTLRIQVECGCCNDRRFAWVDERELAVASADAQGTEWVVRSAIRALVADEDTIHEGSLHDMAQRLVERAA